MKKLLLIAMLWLWKPCLAQQSCRPVYNLPVKTVQVMNGLSLAYIEKGKGDVILFIHGLGGNLSHWAKQVKGLSKKYRCIAIDLPGYGHSDKTITTDSNQLVFYANVVAAFIEAKQLKNVTLAGHSMGGQIAIITALNQAEKISGLVLVAPAGLETFTEAEGKMLTTYATASYFEKQEEPAIRYGFKQNFYALPTDAETLIQDRLRLKTCPDFTVYTAVVSAGIKGMLQQPVKNQLASITKPVLVIFGADDALIPNKILHPALTQEMLKRETMALMPNASWQTIPAAGHLLQFEKCTEVNNAIKSFLK